jgi:hypothetical protein
VIAKDEMTVQVVDATRHEALPGAAIRLSPAIGKSSFPRCAIDAYEINLPIGQSKFKVLTDTSWMALVRLANSEDWISYPLTLTEHGQAQVRINTESQIKVRVRDPSGAPISAVKIVLMDGPTEPVSAFTDHEGRAALIASSAGKYRMYVQGPVWKNLNMRALFATVQPDVYELTVVKSAGLRLTWDAPRMSPPEKALVVLYGSDKSKPLSLYWWTSGQPIIDCHNAVRRIVVFAPGWLPAEAQVTSNAELGESHAFVQVHPGPNLTVPRDDLPKELASPLKATAIALQIAKGRFGPFAEREIAPHLFASEFTPPNGDIVFGPFTPGTYELKILDATGAVVWQQTKTIE